MKITVLALLAATAACSTTALADDAQSQIQATYDAQCKSAISRDVDAFQKTFSPKFVVTDVGGKQQTLLQLTDFIKNMPPGWIVGSCWFLIRNVSVANGSATVLVTRTITGTLAQGMLMQPFTQVQDSTDTWNLSGSPVQTASTITGVRSTLGGKVLDQRGTLSAGTPSP